MKVVTIFKDDNGDNQRIITQGYDKCDIIRKRHNELSAMYYNWEIVKEWKLESVCKVRIVH